MPRIAATVLCLALVVVALWWNIVSYPVVWQMHASQTCQQSSSSGAVAAEKLEPREIRSSAERPRAVEAHIAAIQIGTKQTEVPSAALSPGNTAQYSQSSVPGENAVSEGQTSQSSVTQSNEQADANLLESAAERRYPPEPLITEAASSNSSHACRDGYCAIGRQSVSSNVTVGSNQSAGAMLQWLPPEQQTGSTMSNRQQTAHTAANSGGTSLPAVESRRVRVAQEPSGPPAPRPWSESGALVPVSPQPHDDPTGYQVRRLPPIEDEEQPTGHVGQTTGELPTSYPSTGIE